MIGRTTEKKQLEAQFQKTGNHLVMLYGGRGCGKEQLIQEFSKGKRVFYYRAKHASSKEQLLQFIREIQNAFPNNKVPTSYEECLNQVKSGNASKLLVIIDEVDLMIKKDTSLLDAIALLKGKRLYPGPVMILLCSTAVSWVEKEGKEVLAEHNLSLDGLLKLMPVTFLDVVRGFPNYTVAQCVQTYGILGGIPEYLNRWDGTKSMKENICTHILSPTGFLFREAEDKIGAELRELSVYDTILGAVAAGNEKLNDLHHVTDYSRAKISVYMKNLMAFDIMKKEVSFETGGWSNTKKGVYRILDHYIHFWFTFVYPHLSQVYQMAPEEFYDTYLQPQLDDYFHGYFVDVCREYLQLLNRIGKLPIELVRLGTWIGKQGTIDIIGQSSNRETVVGICNWTEEVMSYQRYEQLLENMQQAKICARVIYLFSAKKFDEKLIELAKREESLVLVDMTEL